jgi:ATP-dependent Zn protease
MKVRPPTHWSERSRVIIYLLLYTALAEYTSPMPFIQSRFGMLVYFLILAYLFKEIWRYREERSPRVHRKAERFRSRIALRRSGLSDFAKYRINRLVRFTFLMYSAGWLIDGATDRCTGAVQCAFLAPKLLTENLPSLIMFALQLAMSMAGIFLMMWLMAKMDLYTLILPDSIKTRFADVYGQDKAVARVKENLDMLDRPDLIEAKGGYMPGGILLEGPPGTGKTMIAEAFAGETGKPFVFLGPGSFSNMFIGVPILKVKMLFRQLRKLSVKYGGVVCFMDEIDALGNRGGDVEDGYDPSCYVDATDDKVIVTGGGGMGTGALEAFLAEMSGLAKPKGFYNRVRVFMGFKPVPPPKYRILFLGATNLAQRLDPALLRPGRFDRRVKVGYPTLEGRIATLEGYLNKVNHNLTDEQVERLGRENARATGASVKDMVNEALIAADKDGREVVTYEDVRDAAIWKALGEDNGKHENDEDNRRVELHEAAHAVAAHYFRKRHVIQFASVHKRGKTGGVVSSVAKEERMGSVKSEMEAHIQVALASRWAELHYFDGDLSTGPSSDVQKATQIMTAMVTAYTMGDVIGTFPMNQMTGVAELPTGIVAEIYASLDDLYDQMAEFMLEHTEHVEAVADLLHEWGTVDGHLIHELLEEMDA